MRTRIYIDGYNLYYGCLKRTSLKWLDLLSLFEKQILPSITWQGKTSPPILDLIAIKFFTASILEQAAGASDSLLCQEQYHSALRKHAPGRIQIVPGYYALTEARAKVIDPDNRKKWPRDCSDIEVWKLEEKQSDVNLAIHALKDALLDEVDHVVIVTNDTDIAPALEMMRNLTTVQIGLVIPTTDHQRIPNKDLSKHAHWIRTHITTAELDVSQLPRVIIQGKKTAIKPLSWYAHSDVLIRALELGVSEKGTTAKVYSWLTLKNVHYNNRTPLDLIESGEGADVIAFMERWANFQA